MLVEAAPVAPQPGMGCCCKTPERAGGLREGGESRRGWRWGSNMSWRQGRVNRLRGAVPAWGGCVVSERRKGAEVVTGRGPDTVRKDFGKSERMQYLQNNMSA